MNHVSTLDWVHSASVKAVLKGQHLQGVTDAKMPAGLRSCYGCVGADEETRARTVKDTCHWHQNANASCQAWRFLAIALERGDTFEREFLALKVRFHKILT